MKNKTGLAVRVGFFTAAAAVAFMIGVFAIGKQSAIFQDKFTLWTTFSQVQGLLIGAPIRLGGVEVGIISSIEFWETTDQTKVKVAMSIKSSVQDRIRKDSQAVIETMGLMGDKYLEVTLGSKNAPMLRDGDYIASQAPAGISTIVEEVNQVVATINEERIPQKISELLENYAKVGADLNTILTGATRGEGILGKLTSSGSDYTNILDELSGSLGNMNKSLNRINRILTKVEKGSGTVGQLITNDTLYKNLDSALKNVSEISAAINRGEGTLGLLLKDKTIFREVADNLLKTSQALASVADQIQSGEGLVPGLINDPKNREILDNLRDASVSLKSATAKIESGEGTIGKFIYDDRVYDDLATILAGAGESTLVKWFVGSNKERGERVQAKELPPEKKKTSSSETKPEPESLQDPQAE